MIKVRKIIVPALIIVMFTTVGMGTKKESESVSVFKVNAENLAINNNEEVFELIAQKTEANKIIKEKIAMYPEFIFDEKNETAYCLDNISIKEKPYDDAQDINSFNKYDEVLLTGTNSLKYWEITIDNKIYYVEHEKITTDKTYIDSLKEQERKAEEERIAEEQRKAAEEQAQKKTQTASYSWNGSVLSKSSGVNYGPTGKETYYNLPMNGVISIMRGIGNNDEYWVRDDGCKMLGQYIMVAANLDIFPRGSLVETSLGTGIVCDTGSFAASNPTQLDIAVTW